MQETTETILTPLKDAYNAKLEQIDKSTRCEDSDIKIGYYAGFKSKHGGIYIGFITKIARKFITIESPYGGWGDTDFIQIMHHKFEKSELIGYYKPLNPQNTAQ